MADDTNNPAVGSIVADVNDTINLVEYESSEIASASSTSNVEIENRNGVAINNRKEIQNDEELMSNLVSAEEYLQQANIQLLEYEKQMFVDMVYNDALLISAKGLGYERVVSNILNVYSDAGNLVLVINSSDWEERYYKSKLLKKHVHEVANTATERERSYLEGGIQFITTRILVVDLLKNRIPIELITGIIVLRAHTVVESCQEAFALRLYRQTNKTGFIKGFSNSSESFTIGYSHIERTMRNLFVKELFIWPRFHAIVQSTLKRYESPVVELHVPLTAKMKLIQSHILDIMNYLVREVKRLNRLVDMEEITVENCVTKKFHKILQAQLDHIWHQLSSQTKLIVADLRILRNLMICTIYNDAVSAYALTKSYRTTEYALNNSGWTLLDAADSIFKLAKERVFNSEDEFDPEFCPKWKYLTEILSVEIPADMKRPKPDCLVPPKVLVLCQDSRTCYQLKQYLMQGAERYLLYTAMRQEIAVGKLSKNFAKLQTSNEFDVLPNQEKGHTSVHPSKQKGEKSFGGANGETDVNDCASAANDTLTDELSQLLSKGDFDILATDHFQESYMLTMTQTQIIPSQQAKEEDEDDVSNSLSESYMNNSIFEPFPEMENLNATQAILSNKQPLICLQTFKTESEGPFALSRILHEIQPQYVIMYHCNVTAIRQLEIYEARQQHHSLSDRMKVFFLIHAQTVEEQSYLTSIRREKQAFEMIIETKRTMVVPEYQDGKSDDAFFISKTYEDPEMLIPNNAITRKAGGQQKLSTAMVKPRIIVDMREFRSDLPCLIHKRGLEVLPVTITIGDYILTPEICVERKSISDLIGSLNSGRLYNQCIQMQRYYAKPILLIEFDQNKPFHLQNKYMLSQTFSGTNFLNTNVSTNVDIVQKLQLLTLHFPKLRLIWSPSPYATAQLFEELKVDKPQPDVKSVTSLGGDDSGAYDDLKFNAYIYDFLLRMPGINTRNIHKLMRHGGSLSDLLKKSQLELSQLLDSEMNGKLFWNILHAVHLPNENGATLNTIGKHNTQYSKFRRTAAMHLQKSSKSLKK